MPSFPGQYSDAIACNLEAMVVDSKYVAKEVRGARASGVTPDHV